ncbi:WXG100 family type VII secretion target [Micromonospora sp. NPDC049559]|uniref:WXG100 family type VII secretion target n=1 Tax=Micromonospora sp. NPDC049559 TaxID=3155923 RepID=UPI003433F3C2
MSTDNPLVAQRQDSTQGVTGFGIAEDISDLVSGLSSGSWIDATIGGVSTGLDALGMVLDPLGSLVSWGVAWLMEHVKPLSEALDKLAGDPDQIAAYAQTWRNAAKHLIEVAGDLRTSVWQDIAGWAGPAADAYRSHAAQHLEALQSMSHASDGIGAVVEGAGLLVALVREMVRDLIADFVSVLAVRLPQWLAEVGLTLGIGTPWVISQVSTLVGKWVARISKLLMALVNSFRKLKPLLGKLGGLVDELGALLRKLGGHDPLDPHNPRAHDADGDGTPDQLDPDGNNDGKLDDFDGDGRPDVPPPNAGGPPLPTTPMNQIHVGEQYPGHGLLPGNGVHYMDDAEREAHRVFVGPDGLLHRSDGTLFDTSEGGAIHTDGVGGRAIFVMDDQGNIYASTNQEVGVTHHSSFLGGQPVAGAGELQVTQGRLDMVTDHSGHYRPGRTYTNQVVDTLRNGGVRNDFHVDYWAPEGT